VTSKPGALALTLAVCGALHAAPAAEAIDPGSLRAIRDCVLDGDLDRRYPNELLRRAQRQVPSDYAEYSNCTEVLGAAILDTGAAAPPGGGGGAGFDGSEPGRSTPDVKPGRATAADGGELSLAREGGAAGAERREGAPRPAASTAAAGFPWLWLLLASAAALGAAGLLFRERLATLVSRRFRRGRQPVGGAAGQPPPGTSGRGG
jgi:hypothetical protein